MSINLKFQNKYCPICDDEVYAKYGTSSGHLIFNEYKQSFGVDHISIKTCEECWSEWRKRSIDLGHLGTGCLGYWKEEYGLICLGTKWVNDEEIFLEPIDIITKKIKIEKDTKSIKQFLLG